MQEKADRNKIGPMMKPIKEEKRELVPFLPLGVGIGDGFGDGLDFDFCS